MQAFTFSYTYDDYNNRAAMTVAGQYATTYSYDKNSRLITEEKAAGGVTETTRYSYDNNGNQIYKGIETLVPAGEGSTGTLAIYVSGEDAGSGIATFNEFDGLNQLVKTTTGDKTIGYAYNGDSLRVSKTVNDVIARHIWDGNQIVMDITGTGSITGKYIRGINLIYSQNNAGTKKFYLFNGHGDVVQLTGNDGSVIKIYDYDAFGNEKNPDGADTNPFRYCGEYFDKEAGTYYLRARYYNLATSRMLSPDTHWNPSNMIYGDNPVKWNEHQDPMGLNVYTYKPDIMAIMQSGNLYAFCMNNPIMYVDPSGNIAYPGQTHNMVVNYVANKYDYAREQTISYNNSILWGRADLINPNTGEVWDVKRDKMGQIATGVAQVLKYTQNTWKKNPDPNNISLSIGGFIDPDSFVRTINIDTYYISYRYAGGVIAYDYYKVTDWRKVGGIATGFVVVAGVTFLIVATDGMAAPALIPVAAKAFGG